MHTRLYFPNRRYAGEARCLTHRCGARVTKVGPNKIHARARFQRPDTLVLNFNGGPAGGSRQSPPGAGSSPA